MMRDCFDVGSGSWGARAQAENDKVDGIRFECEGEDQSNNVQRLEMSMHRIWAFFSSDCEKYSCFVIPYSSLVPGFPDNERINEPYPPWKRYATPKTPSVVAWCKVQVA